MAGSVLLISNIPRVRASSKASIVLAGLVASIRRGLRGTSRALWCMTTVRPRLETLIMLRELVTANLGTGVAITLPLLDPVLPRLRVSIRRADIPFKCRAGCTSLPTKVRSTSIQLQRMGDRQMDTRGTISEGRLLRLEQTLL